MRGTEQLCQGRSPGNEQKSWGKQGLADCDPSRSWWLPNSQKLPARCAERKRVQKGNRVTFYFKTDGLVSSTSRHHLTLAISVVNIGDSLDTSLRSTRGSGRRERRALLCRLGRCQCLIRRSAAI